MSIEMEMRGTVLHLTALAQDKRPPTSGDMDRLTDYLRFRMTTEAGHGHEQQFRVSERLGYLEFDVLGEPLFVPCHLAPVFPSREIAAEAVKIGRAIALQSTSPICLSGSTTFLGELGSVGDLDYCEYYLDDPKLLPSSLSAKIALEPPTPLAKVYCAGRVFGDPWEKFEDETHAALFSIPGADPANAMMMDFVTDTPLGLLPTTSLVLPLGDDRESDNALRSHAYQEAVIGPVKPVRILDDVGRFGDYTTFLLKEAEKLISGDTDKPVAVRGPKALKRLLSYVLLLGETELKSEVVAGLDNEVIDSIVLAGRQDELDKLSGMLGEPHRSWLRKRMETIRKGAPPLLVDEEELHEVIADTLEIAQSVLDEINLLLQTVRSSS